MWEYVLCFERSLCEHRTVQNRTLLNENLILIGQCLCLLFLLCIHYYNCCDGNTFEKFSTLWDNVYLTV
jgi:hypothetical protein